MAVLPGQEVCRQIQHSTAGGLPRYSHTGEHIHQEYIHLEQAIASVAYLAAIYALAVHWKVHWKAGGRSAGSKSQCSKGQC